MDITNNGLELKQRPQAERINFWDNLFQKYNYLWYKPDEYWFSAISKSPFRVPLGIVIIFTLFVVVFMGTRYISRASKTVKYEI